MNLSTQKKIEPPIRLATADPIQLSTVPNQEPEFVKIATIGASIGVDSCHLNKYNKNLLISQNLFLEPGPFYHDGK
jgi:hypothetical protein